ncbi:MAPK regulated corepressor interacting protein 2-like [Uranotaenia lowii]|uniref:MAPK regulated corepressor interacting protein 2 n=1 Tax=Uranotaenia lowii TaxID=190385 RepID=UPI002478B12E|nr:MAPK regulated corepressor interacting protein 2 [Uranotaenia lowii]XP_055610008.1 MAPK regulated corepressor interacting protein 2-like [Uranotaenia lowii]
MYTVSKGPSKLVAKTRRGIPQNYEKFELMRELGKKNGDCDITNGELSVPRPVFQTAKKSSAQHLRAQQQNSESSNLSPQHEELIKYINDSWNMAVAPNPYDVPGSPDCESSSMSSACSTSSMSSDSSSSSTTTLYYNDPPSPVLVDFKPFDLESWWGRRIFNNITKNL